MNSLTIQFFYFDIFLDDSACDLRIKNMLINELFSIWKKGKLLNKKLKWCNKNYYALEWMSIPWVTINFLKKMDFHDFNQLVWQTFIHTSPQIVNYLGRNRCHWIAKIIHLRKPIFNRRFYPSYLEITKKDNSGKTPIKTAQDSLNLPMIYIFMNQLIKKMSSQYKIPFEIELLIRNFLTYNTL
tara:strand:- start:426 stop:977 length:552 start_codon:yes stop_codon:yes gene_type:complete